MNKDRIYFGTPQQIEKQRITEINNMSYIERYYKLIAIIELSQLLKNGKKYSNINAKK
jgi:hypothetical protein